MGTWNCHSMGWDGGWGSWRNVNQSLVNGNLVQGTFLIYLLQWNWYYSVKRPPSQEWLCCTTTILVGWLVGESDKNPNCDLSPINSCWAVGRLLNLNGRFERKCWLDDGGGGWWRGEPTSYFKSRIRFTQFGSVHECQDVHVHTEITLEARFWVYITCPTQHNSTTSTQTALICK